jgi:hypothetical protein
MLKPLPLLTLTSLLVIASNVSAQEKKSITKDWEAHLSIQKPAGKNRIEKYAQEYVFKKELQIFNMALKEVSNERKQYGAFRIPYDIIIKGEIVFNSPKLLSYKITDYRFTGGAHGMAVTRTYNFATSSNGKPYFVGFDSVFKTSEQSLNEVSLNVLEQVIKNERTSWVQEGTILTFSKEMLNRFTLSKKGVTFYFDQYDLAPYVEGRFEFLVEWKNLTSTLKSFPYLEIRDYFNLP